MSTLRSSGTMQYDEEESLGFDVFVAELELFVGNKQERRFDEVQLLELLQKLLPSITRADKTQIKQFQKRCESALVEGCLLKGVCREVRQLIYSCLGKIYTLGDMLPMYSRVNTLQAFLNSKDFAAKTTAENVRVGVLDCLAHLALHQGRYLASGATESMAIACKIVPKSAFSNAVRCAALRLASAVIEGLGAQDRSALSIQTEAYKMFEKHIKKESSFLKEETPDEIRQGAWEVLASICRAGAVALWANGGALLEEAIKLGVLGLEDPCQAVQQSCAAALGELAAAPRHPTAQTAVNSEKQPRKKASLERLLSSTMKSCLVLPFCEAAVYNKREVCQALASSWSAFSSILQQRYHLDEDGLVDVAVQAVGLLEACSRSYAEAREKGLLPPDTELGACVSGGELPLAQACIMYLLRVSVVEQLGETGQRKLLEKLTQVTASSQAVPAVVVALEGVGLLLELLGEVTDEIATNLESAITSKVTASCMAVRSQAASALCALALSVPHTAAKLFGNCLECLEAAALQLAHATAPNTRAASVSASPLVPMGTPRASGAPKDKQLMDAVSGFALAASALSVACVGLPLGVPSRLPLTAYTVAKRLISQPYAGTSAGRSVEREAGFTLLGSLVVSMHHDSLLERQDEMLQLFSVAFGPTARQQLDDKNYAKPGGEVELAVQLWWRAVALESLQAYVVGVIGKGYAHDTAGQVRQISEMLSPLLQTVQKQPGLQDPFRARGGPGGWPAAAAAFLQLRLLEVYFYLPGPHMFAADHASIIKLCIRPLRGNPPGTTLSPECAAAVGRSSLRGMLNSQDAVLGPWVPGRDLLEDELRMFTGDRGGPQQHPWEAGMAFTSSFLSNEQQPGGGSGGRVRVQRRFMPFSQPQALGPALLEMQLWLLGKMMAVISPNNQFQVLEVVNAAVVLPKGNNKKDREVSARRVALCRCAAVATLAALGPMMKRAQKNVQEGGEKLAEKLLQLANSIIDDNLSDAAICRAGAEIIAAAGCVGGDATAVRLVKSLCKSIKDSVAENKDVDRRPVWALALGSIHRSKGGMALQSVSGATSEALVMCASRPTGTVHMWALHGLWLLANAAGLAYMPHVRNTLQLSQELLVSAFGEHPSLKPFAARLANAMVAVLGPEFTLGSAHYRRCKSLVVGCELSDAPVEGQADNTRRFGQGETTLAELERVLFVQQLILFSPKAVPAYKHIALLEATLPSPRPSLRKAAAATLRHLAERDTQSVLDERIELSLFTALDAEADPATSNQLKATLRTLLAAGALTAPSYWIKMLGDVAMSNTQAIKAGLWSESSAPVQSPRDVDDDDEEGYASAPRPAAPPPQPAETSTSGRSHPARTMTTTPRLRTRLFAADCLLSIFRIVQEDSRHSDVDMVQHTHTDPDRSKGDWLVQHLQGLTDLGFRLATGQTEALKPLGVRLLETIIRTFGSLPDPVIEDALLLEQYQAQFVSALRAALSGFNVPTLAIAGGTLATTFLDSGLAGGDAAVMKRLMELLTTPLGNWDALEFEAYAEWVGVRTKVALLQAHARCACIAKQHHAAGEGDLTANIVEKAHGAHRDMLLAMWTALVVDYAVLATQPSSVHAQYKSALYGESSPAVVAAIQHHYAAACPVVLEALTASLEHAEALVTARSAALGDNWNVSSMSTPPAGCHATGPESPQHPSGSPTAADAVQRHKQQTWQAYCMLLDVTIMLLCETAMMLAASLPQAIADGEDINSDVDRLVGALKAASMLLGQDYLSADLCPAHVALDLIRTLTTITYQVTYPLQWHMYKRSTTKYTSHVSRVTSAIASLLKQLVLNMPASFLPASTNVPVAITECILSCTSIICPFARLDKAASGYLLTGATGYVGLTIEGGSDEERAGQGLGASGHGAPSSHVEQSLVALLVAGQSLLKRLSLEDSPIPATHLLEMGVRLLATLPVGVQLSAAQRFFEGCMSLVTEHVNGQTEKDQLVGDALLEACVRAVLGVVDGVQSGLQNYLAVGYHDINTRTTGTGQAARAEQARTRICTQLSAALGAAALLPQTTTSIDPESGGVLALSGIVRKHCKAVLAQALQPQQPIVLRSKVVSAVRTLLQENGSVGGPKQQWCLEILAAVAPQLSLLVHNFLQRDDAPLEGDGLEAVTESLKCFVVGVTALGSKGEPAQACLLRVLVPLLVEAASPPGAGGSPSLKDMSIKLVMHMPQGAAAGAFRLVLGGLLPSLKQRLQTAIRDAATSAGPAVQPSGTAVTSIPVIAQPAKPTITLKTNFAFPKPT